MHASYFCLSLQCSLVTGKPSSCKKISHQQISKDSLGDFCGSQTNLELSLEKIVRLNTNGNQ